MLGGLSHKSGVILNDISFSGTGEKMIFVSIATRFFLFCLAGKYQTLFRGAVFGWGVEVAFLPRYAALCKLKFFKNNIRF